MSILVAALLLAIFLAWISNGDLRRLEAVPLKHAWLFMVAAVMQVLLFLPGASARWFGGYVPYLYIASFLLVLAPLVLNLRVAGLPLAAAGVGSNLVAIVANGGYMPVSRAAVERLGLLDHFGAAPGVGPGALVRLNNILDPNARLAFLGDVFGVKVGPLPTIFSIGDIVLATGLAWLLIHYSRRPRGRHRAGTRAQREGRAGRADASAGSEDG